jgi:hypothetical protein
MASVCSQRRTVDADTEARMPRRAASAARSGQFHVANGTPLSAGEFAGQRLHLGHDLGGEAAWPTRAGPVS